MKEIELYSFNSNYVLPFVMMDVNEDDMDEVDDMYQRYEKVIRESYFKEMQYWKVDFYENNYDIYIEPKLENWETIHIFQNKTLNKYIDELVSYLQKVPIMKGSNFGYSLIDKFDDNCETYDVNFSIGKSDIIVTISASVYDDEIRYDFSR